MCRVFPMDQCAYPSHTFAPLNPYPNPVRHHYYRLHFRVGETDAPRDHRARGGRTQICLNPACGLWSHSWENMSTNGETEPRKGKVPCLWAPAYQGWARTRTRVCLPEQCSALGLSERRGVPGRLLPCFPAPPEQWALVLNEHMPGPFCMYVNVYVQSEAGVILGWQVSVLRILHKTAGPTLDTFCHVFVPEQWWCLYFLAITLF